MVFQRAVKYDAKLRLALAGPSGSGKTFTALLLACALAGDSGRVAVIDTERGSAAKYADIFTFDVSELDKFSPDAFVAAMREAEAAGYSVLVIDSISHEWNGSGGILEIVDNAAKRMKTPNTYTAWSEGTPRHNSFIDAILRSKMHVICTMRSKEEHVQERIDGRTVIRKIGMGPIQRDGIMYEFDIAGELDYEHTMCITKSRCPAIADAVIRRPDTQMAETLKTWLRGVTPPPAPIVDSTVVTALPGEVRVTPDENVAATEQQLSSIRKLCERLGKPEPENLETMRFLAAKELIATLTQEYRARADRPAQNPQPVQPQADALTPVTPEQVEQMRKYISKVFGCKNAGQLEARWTYAKQQALKRKVADPDLSATDLASLRKFAQDEERKMLGGSSGK